MKRTAAARETSTGGPFVGHSVSKRGPRAIRGRSQRIVKVIMKLINVPYIDQSEKWPTGCESVTAVMALNHAGVDISVDDFINGCLDTAGFETRDGVLYGPDPNECFVGSPYDRDSFGCYAPAIKKALGRALPDGYETVDLTGEPMDVLARGYLDKDVPVIFWATIDMLDPYDGSSWRLDDGSVFTWRCNEHCLLLVGYDDGSWIFNDPWANRGVSRVPRALAKRRHEEMFSMALAVTRRANP